MQMCVHGSESRDRFDPPAKLAVSDIWMGLPSVGSAVQEDWLIGGALGGVCMQQHPLLLHRALHKLRGTLLLAFTCRWQARRPC